MEKLLTEKEVYECEDGMEFIQVNKNKYNGTIKEIKVTVDKKYNVMFGIWANWNEKEWDCLGYKKVEVAK